MRISFQKIRCTQRIVDPDTGDSQECGHISTNPIGANRHVKDEHEGRVYRCWCGKESRSQNEHTKHERTHNPLVICPVQNCQLRSNRPNTLYRHIRSKFTHLVQLSKAQIEEYIKTAATLYKNGRAAVKQEFLDKKAAAQISD